MQKYTSVTADHISDIQSPSVNSKALLKNRSFKSKHLVIVGLDDIVTNKYFPYIQSAIKDGYINSYSIIELEVAKEDVEEKVKVLGVKPQKIYYLPDSRLIGKWANPKDFEPVFEEIININGEIRVYIATELKAHYEYLKYCVENGIDSLVEKPVLAPMDGNRFVPNKIMEYMENLDAMMDQNPAFHSVMTLGRYHQIYNERLIQQLRTRVIKYEAPVTSFHFRHAGGVWNTHKEYEIREDHPYKHGYGMIMHGAYHYIDVSVQVLLLNKLIYPDKNFKLVLSSYVGYPKDQNDRISKKFSKEFEDDKPEWGLQASNKTIFGETDIVTSFALKEAKSGSVLTLGTLAFEQTTPSIRTWKDIPEGIYNKNGRISGVDIEAQLSTLHSISVQVFDLPVAEGKEIDRIDAFARVSTRSNASLLDDEEYNTEECFNGLFHSDSNKMLIDNWLRYKEDRSQFKDHLPVMRLVQALCLSAENPGEKISLDFI